MIYPWHETQRHNLIAQKHSLPNAWLFSGKRNIGKTEFARYIAQALLCESPNSAGDACGVCASCHLSAQGSHPDFYELTPEISETEAMGRKLLQIKIEAVRRVIENIRLTAVRGGWRIVLIHPAESMNVQAANSLLKVLEEPPDKVLFLLVTHMRDQLLPTVKSRCRHMVLPAPSQKEALEYLHGQQMADAESLLAFHGGAPLFEGAPDTDRLREQLLGLLAEPRLLAILDYATDFDKHKLPLAVFLNWLHKWLLDIGLAQRHILPLYYPHHVHALAQIGAKTSPISLFVFVDCLNRLSPYGYHTLNVKIQIEDLLIEYLKFWQNK